MNTEEHEREGGTATAGSTHMESVWIRGFVATPTPPCGWPRARNSQPASERRLNLYRIHAIELRKSPMQYSLLSCRILGTRIVTISTFHAVSDVDTFAPPATEAGL
jgi:hypothetical protein